MPGKNSSGICFLFLSIFICLIPFQGLSQYPGEAARDSAAHLLRIVQISDVQLGFTFARARETSLIPEFRPDSSLIDVDKSYFEWAVSCMNSLSPKPDVVVNTGDLVNDSENQRQWNDYLMIADKIEAPLYEIMGNHEGWSAAGVDKFKNRFQHNDYYCFMVKECLFIVLNSWYLKYPEQNPQAANEQRDFLSSALQDHPVSKYKVILMHFPVYLQSPDEEEAYFNLPPQQRKWLLDLAYRNKVKIILTGHNHRNSQVTYKDSVTIITTGPISEPLGMNSDSTRSRRGFRIIDLNLATGAVSQKFIHPDDSSFSVVFLGDMHFDKRTHHQMEWVIKTHPADTSQIRQYSEKTSTFLPALHNDVRAQVNDPYRRVSFVVQSGDFVEGLCGNYLLAVNQFNDFIGFANTYVKVPYLVSKGNHEITGPGADSAYRQVIFPFINKETGKEVNDSKYVFKKNNAVFFFYDDYSYSSLNWLEEEMKKYAYVKNKFVIMHEPVVPFTARSKWTVFSMPEEKKDRDRLLGILGDNNAIVLAGHLHKYGLVVRKAGHGKFIQLSVSSVLDKLTQDPVDIRSGIQYYSEDLVNDEPGFSSGDRDERKERLRNEKPFIEYFESADFQGYVILTIEKDQVVADLYSGTGLRKWKSVILSQLF